MTSRDSPGASVSSVNGEGPKNPVPTDNLLVHPPDRSSADTCFRHPSHSEQKTLGLRFALEFRRETCDSPLTSGTGAFPALLQPGRRFESCRGAPKLAHTSASEGGRARHNTSIPPNQRISGACQPDRLYNGCHPGNRGMFRVLDLASAGRLTGCHGGRDRESDRLCRCAHPCRRSVCRTRVRRLRWDLHRGISRVAVARRRAASDDSRYRRRRYRRYWSTCDRWFRFEGRIRLVDKLRKFFRGASRCRWEACAIETCIPAIAACAKMVLAHNGSPASIHRCNRGRHADASDGDDGRPHADRVRGPAAHAWSAHGD